MIAASSADAKPPRPCTEYNLYFQLERAHILQTMHGAHPTASSSDEVFHPSQPSYVGLPPLPDRYASIALPYDWFLPGKERRRKRKHRRSHGVVGFHELSDMVAASWKALAPDDEIREYCSKVWRAGVERYRAEMAEWKKNGGIKIEKGKKKAPKLSSEGKYTQNARKMNDLDIVLSAPIRPHRDNLILSKNNMPKITRTLSDESARSQDTKSETSTAPRQVSETFKNDTSIADMFSDTIAGGHEALSSDLFVRQRRLLAADGPCILGDVSAPDNAASCRNVSIVSNVDIDDEEIIGMWNTEPSVDHEKPQCSDRATPTFSSMAQVEVNAMEENDQNRAALSEEEWSQTLQEMQVQRMRAIITEQRRAMVVLQQQTLVARSA